MSNYIRAKSIFPSDQATPPMPALPPPTPDAGKFQTHKRQIFAFPLRQWSPSVVNDV